MVTDCPVTVTNGKCLVLETSSLNELLKRLQEQLRELGIGVLLVKEADMERGRTEDRRINPEIFRTVQPSGGGFLIAAIYRPISRSFPRV